MADLRVAHQPVLQPDGQTVSFELYVVVSVTDVVHVGRLAVKDGVALFVVWETPSVVDAIRRRLNEWIKIRNIDWDSEIRVDLHQTDLL
jgi:hypothetical protein